MIANKALWLHSQTCNVSQTWRQVSPTCTVMFVVVPYGAYNLMCAESCLNTVVTFDGSEGHCKDLYTLLQSQIPDVFQQTKRPKDVLYTDGTKSDFKPLVLLPGRIVCCGIKLLSGNINYIITDLLRWFPTILHSYLYMCACAGIGKKGRVLVWSVSLPLYTSHFSNSVRV